jgi:hypothetical protein
MSFRHARSVELGAVALERHDERAIGHRAWVRRAPEREAAAAKIAHDQLGALLLAIRREHGAGIEAAAVDEGDGRALAQRRFVPSAREGQPLPQADDTCTADGDLLAWGMTELIPSATPCGVGRRAFEPVRRRR